MKKRFIIWLSALLITLLPALGSRAEGAGPDSSPESDVMVIYVPYTQAEPRIITAKYVAKAIQGRFPGQSHLYKTTASSDSIEFAQIFNYKQDALQKLECRPDAGKAHEIWLIVPSEASINVVNHEQWMPVFDNALAGNSNSRLHVVFIGGMSVDLKETQAGEISLKAADAPVTPDVSVTPDIPENPDAEEEVQTTDNPELPEEQQTLNATRLEQLAEKYPGRVNWIVIREMFEEANTDPLTTVHTGDYFIASLYGEPMNLVIQTDEETGKQTFEMPGQGNAFVLVRSQGNDLDILSPDGTPVGTRSSITVSIATDRNGFYGLFLTNIAGGTYTVSSGASGIKGYWYPDFDAVKPELDLGETETTTEWSRGEKTFRLTMDPMPGRADQYTVSLKILKNGGSTDVSNSDIPYNTDDQAWEMTLPIDSRDEDISITPSIVLRMPDDNLIRKWEGKTEQRHFSSKAITEKSVDDRTVYCYGDSAGEPLEYNWSDIFDYGINDGPEFSVLNGDELQRDYGVEITRREDNTGFAVTVTNTELLKEKQACTVQVSVKNQTGSEKENSFIIRSEDVSGELREKIWIEPGNDAAPIQAGGEVRAVVRIPAETAERWKEISAQNHSFPALENLTAEAVIQGEGETPLNQSERISLTQGENGWTADVSVPVPEDLRAGNYTVAVDIYPGNEIVDPYKEEKLPFDVVNTAPFYTGTLKESVTESIEGFSGISIPGIGTIIGDSYQEINLLEQLGLTNAWKQFDDAETLKSLKVTMTISPVDGLRKEEPRQESTSGEQTEDPDAFGEEAEDPAENPEKEDTWSYVLTEEMPLVPDKIYAQQPGDYTITLTADDGANEPVARKIRVTIESDFLKTAKWVAMGAAALLALLIVLLIIRHARKPKFDRIRIRCLVWADDSQDRGREMMNKTKPVSMSQFGKNPVTLNTALMLARQPALPKELEEIAEDITLLPTKHDELNIVFGKKSMANLGQQDKKISISPGNAHRIRMGNQYLLIENVQ